MALTLLACMIAAGCSGPPRGSDVPSPPTAAVRDRAGAPVIIAPRDLRSRAADPCGTLLTPVQLRSLGFPRPGIPSTNVLGPTCTWKAAGAGSRSIEVSVVVTRDLFLDTYAARALPIFRPNEVGGLPAVDSKVEEDDPACTTTVGVADGQTLDVSSARGTYKGERDADACAISRRVAEEIVATLPPL